MEFIKLTALSKTHKKEILKLWNTEYPEKLNFKTALEFENYLENLKDATHILMTNDKQEVKGWYVDFTRENKKWLVLIVDAKQQHKGFGTKLLDLAKKKERELYGWVIDHTTDKKKNGKFYQSPLNFYEINGFKKVAEDRLEHTHISAVKIKWKKKIR